jgi:hypothetical protein
MHETDSTPQRLIPFAPEVWTATGETVPFFGLPYSTRMTVIRLPDRSLFIHSPEKLDNDLIAELTELGEVRHLISPNKLHHLFLQEWLDAFPQAKSYAAPGLAKRFPELRFDAQLDDQAPPEWAGEIEQLVFRGSPAMEEAVFFHRPSRTLILTDLVENFAPEFFTPFQRLIARFTGILAPDGRTPVDWRFTFRFGRATAQQCLERMLSWEPERIIISHGRCIEREGGAFLRHSFRWLKKETP